MRKRNFHIHQNNFYHSFQRIIKIKKGGNSFFLFASTERKITKQIRGYFDEVSVKSSKRLVSCPILRYEQDVRHKAVIEMLDPKKGNRTLGVGCGNARDISVFAVMGTKCVGLDISKEMLREGMKKLCSRRIKNVLFVVSDGTNLPFRNEIFDKVSCSEVIEHIPRYEKCIKEMVRVLKKNGRLVITTPNKNSLYGLIKKMEHIIIGFLGMKRKHPYDEWKTMQEVIDILSSYGINVDKSLGICFIPSQITYWLPENIKKITVSIVSRFENRIRKRFHSWGYMIGLTGNKIMSYGENDKSHV